LTQDERSGGTLRARIVSSDEQLELLRMRLHDSTLQTLEFIANAGAMDGADVERLVRLAAREATELRYMLEGLTRETTVTLTDALREVATAAEAYGPEDVVLAVGEADDSVESFTALELAAAVREALTNARKHAKAKRVVVYLEEHDCGALVTVKDDGDGMDLEELKAGLGIGVSMRGRMRRLGGEMDFHSIPGNGLLVTFRLPAPAEPADADTGPADAGDDKPVEYLEAS
jgi:signal transduction histidine kinase